jgi:hypothetical protein
MEDLVVIAGAGAADAHPAFDRRETTVSALASTLGNTRAP